MSFSSEQKAGHSPDTTKVNLDSAEHEVGIEQSDDGLISKSRERKLVRRLDARLMPIVILLYLWSFLDRINISSALTLGLQKDLGLKGYEANIALAVFYVPYVLFEIPSNYFLKKIGPQLWCQSVTLSVVLFGIVVLCHGFLKNYSGLLAARFFLGLVEAGILPGCSYLLTMWYKPSEILQRYAIFLNAVTLAGAFGSLLASGISKMDGIRGYAGWRWIFIIEGIVTVLVGVVAFLFTPNLPEQARWLSEKDLAFMQARLAQQEDQRHAPLSAGLKRYFSDYRSYIAGLLYCGANIVGYGVSYFLPTIVQGFHYSPIQTQLHAVPPFACAFGWSIFLSFVCSRLSGPNRLVCACLSFCIAIAGFGILLSDHKNLHLQYAALFLAVAGLFGGLPTVLVYYFMQLERNWQRTIGTAYMIGFGNIGGIISTFSFLPKDASHHYHTGYIVMMFGICLATAGTIAMGLSFERSPLRR